MIGEGMDSKAEARAVINVIPLLLTDLLVNPNIYSKILFLLNATKTLVRLLANKNLYDIAISVNVHLTTMLLEKFEIKKSNPLIL